MIKNEGINRCFHCGEDCGSSIILYDEKPFCCSGCQTVYEILSGSNSSEYYKLSDHPGMKTAARELGKRYDFLDNEEIKQEILDFSDNGVSRVKFFIPSIHCSSCIWLLENLHRLNKGIMNSTVHFTKKEAVFTFRDSEISLRGLVELLASVNYAPYISLESVDKSSKKKINKDVYYRLGVAGFCFGNIMLFSFPSYLAIDDTVEQFIRQNFGILNILLGIPVAFYSGSGFFISAYKGLKKRFISIDLPIAIGILALFFRSVYEILSGTGPGFMDSLAGLLFFLLIGKWYQGLTYQALSFERDYRSYFPVAVTLISEKGEESILPLKHLKTGMRILVRNNELIPADAILVKGEGSIDYSFVSGESDPVKKTEGQRIFAGGKQAGPAIELIIEKEVTQSKLTELWNQKPGHEERQNNWESLMDVISRYFTAVVLILALVTGVTWWFIDPSRAALVVTAILIVACPCALAMTLPFSFGGAMRVFGRNGFYVKRSSVVEALSRVNTVVLDKTGTLTKSNDFDANLDHLLLPEASFNLLRSLVRHSTHPMSVAVYQALPNAPALHVNGFTEHISKGVEGTVGAHHVKLGSGEFVLGGLPEATPAGSLFVSVDGSPSGYIILKHKYRDGMRDVLSSMGKKYELHLLSGDNDAELPALLEFFPSAGHMNFNQTPVDKLNYIRKLREEGKKVMMIGDGLNDAGALYESDCGISIADDVYHFSPSCDAILEARQFRKLSTFLIFSKLSRRIVIMSMLFSFSYNIVGLSFAISGNLTPIVSAILMPLSSVSVITLITVATYFASVKTKLNKIYPV
ncbi:MAG: heavy metal translocating P-type ATPase metal-binding domain-containing protein [Bacteroidota bacterium]